MNSPNRFGPASNVAEVNVYSTQTEMHDASFDEKTEWTPLLLATGGNSNGGSTSNDLLIALKGGVTIRVQDASELSMEKLGQITRLSDAQVAKSPGLLNRFDPEAAMNEDTVFAYAVRDDELVAAVHATRSDQEENRLLHIANLNSDKSEPGIAVPLIAALFLGDAHWSHSPANAEAVARVLPNGSANIGSTKTMMRLGFYTTKFFTHPVTTRNPQKTMPGSAEANGAALKYLLLRGDAMEVLARSEAALSGWTLRFSKTRAI